MDSDFEDDIIFDNDDLNDIDDVYDPELSDDSIEGSQEDDDAEVDVEADEPEQDDEFIELDDEKKEEIKIVYKDKLDKYKNQYNKIIVIIDPNKRITSHILSKYEMTNITSCRSSDISIHNNCMVDITGLDCPIKQAKRELMMRRCPYIVRRYVGELNGEEYYEDWDPNTMTFATQYSDVL